MGISVVEGAGHEDRGSRAPRSEYVGEDRRAYPVPGEPFRFGILAGVVIVLGVAAATIVWARLADVSLPPSIDSEGLRRFVAASTAVLAVVAGLVSVVRWRLIGEASALWIGTGILVFGVVTIGFAELLPDVYPGAASDRFLAGLGPASHTVAVTVLLLGAVAPAVDTRLRPRSVLTSTVGAVVVLTVGVVVILGPEPGLDSVEARSAFAVMWIVVAAAHVRAARRRKRRHHLAAGVMAFGFGLAQLVGAIGAGLASGADPGPGLLTVLSVGLVLLGAGRELEAAFVTQRAEMLEKALAVEFANAKRRAEHAAHEERVHDARNAILAIDGAAHTLERFRERLTGEQREALSNAVREEIQRLQRLIEVEWDEEECRPFLVSALLVPIATTERARGMRLTVEAPGDLKAVGRTADTAEVVRNLLDNARRYAPGSPVEVNTERDGEWVVIRVEDRGRGVRREEREMIFERGHRGTAADGTPGTGLGLFISRRLMREQGGDMWVENRDGGGASFGLCLPAAEATPRAHAPSLGTDAAEPALMEEAAR